MGCQTTNRLLKNLPLRAHEYQLAIIELLATGLSIEEIVRDYYPSLSEDMVK